MANIVVIGNSGGGKSTLARTLAARRGLLLIEIDRLLWQPGWNLTPVAVYQKAHADLIARDGWLIDGLGYEESIPARIARATEIILIDMPLWMHFWLAAERQLAWAKGPIDHAPAGAASMPPTRELFKTIWEVEQTWMPKIRDLCRQAEQSGTKIVRLGSPDELDSFSRSS